MSIHKAFTILGILHDSCNEWSCNKNKENVVGKILNNNIKNHNIIRMKSVKIMGVIFQNWAISKCEW